MKIIFKLNFLSQENNGKLIIDLGQIDTLGNTLRCNTQTIKIRRITFIPESKNHRVIGSQNHRNIDSQNHRIIEQFVSEGTLKII